MFTGRLSVTTHPWLVDHAVLGTIVLPGSALLEMSLAVAQKVGSRVIEELVLEAPLVLEGQHAVHLQLTVSAPDDNGKRALSVHSRSEASELAQEHWTRHAVGLLGSDAAGTDAVSEKLLDDELARFAGEPWPPTGAETVEIESLYSRLAEAGYKYGSSFQRLTAIYKLGDDIYGEATIGEADDSQGAAGFTISPALLDAAFHTSLLAADERTAGRVEVPFSFSGVRLYGSGATTLRVRLGGSRRPDTPDPQRLAFLALDGTGKPVMAIDSVVSREIDRAALAAVGRPRTPSPFTIGWTELRASSTDELPLDVALLDADTLVEVSDLDARCYKDLAALDEAINEGVQVPECVLVFAKGLTPAPSRPDELATAVHDLTAGVLSLLQAFLGADRLRESKLVLVTENALSAGRDEVPDLSQAALPGLVRSARSEHPGRVVLLDSDDGEHALTALRLALASDEPELAIREGMLLTPKLVNGSDTSLLPPVGEPAWHLRAASTGTLEDLSLIANPAVAEPLASGQVRVAVHAAGLNFRDVLVAVGVYPGEAKIGGEGAGVVLEVAPDVSDFVPGDRVMGLMPDSFGPIAVSDARWLVRIPEEWSCVQAASVPLAFLTAHYALCDLAELHAGERLLLHSAAGGVGMAALQLARHIGAELFVTAHPEKWHLLEQLGVDDRHIASSRSSDFRQRFLEATNVRGVDVVLNSLAGELVDASLDLLPRGGRFIEMGKTDIRDQTAVASQWRGVRYRAFDLQEASPDRVREMLSEIMRLFESGVLDHLPTSVFDVRQSRDAFQVLREARHVGKIVLRIPRPPDRDGTILITGGTGQLGALVARHSAKQGAKHLMLLSRRGIDADGAKGLEMELSETGRRDTHSRLRCERQGGTRAGDFIDSRGTAVNGCRSRCRRPRRRSHFVARSRALGAGHARQG